MFRTVVRRIAQWGLERGVMKAALQSSLTAPAEVPPGFQPTGWSGTIDRRAFPEAAPPAAFITARFRSGSTLLWKLLREHRQLTAYYEPLNPRRWFDPAARGQRVDNTHRGVEQYWEEYNRFAGVEVPWEEWWSSRDLYLPATVPAHTLYEYLRLLVDEAPGFPVLQFNRLDFRLGWIASRFPDVLLVHLHRDPRDQWISTFLRQKPVPTTATVANFARSDEFYLVSWANDLARYIPLFAEVKQLHPYELSYIVSRLSFVFASNHSAYDVSYESLVSEPRAVMKSLGDVFKLEGMDQLPGIGQVSTRSVGRWKSYADASWFEEREARCDELIDQCVLGRGSTAVREGLRIG
ncbi:hypothetical protein KOR34_36110 [Posidoniimonas corsicana]|uniref:Sulfotransferase domain protein n=1 Tax=Posidoniimonas corsicana TaxID=1938618 RepID=A0A5C5V7H9_9BACT|nr:sulfotransferase [Posidoniimonas corsicana]TWT33777.1 hypothetical protein KOR34_36110 [Posidoniimonas corsicana]